MARLVVLGSRRLTVVAAFLFVSVLARPVGAQTPMMQETAAAPAPAATNAAPFPTPPVDTLGRFGKILAPGTEVSHPLKLNIPVGDIGEVKIPTSDELVMRDKLEQLAKLSDADIRTQLAEWPAFNSMSLRDEGVMLQRIQDFRDHHKKMAQSKAHDMGLLTLTPDQQDRFEKEYWDMKLKLDHDLARQFQPVVAARMQKLQEDLYREFSVANPVPAPGGSKTVPTGQPKTTAIPAFAPDVATDAPGMVGAKTPGQ